MRPPDPAPTDQSARTPGAVPATGARLRAMLRAVATPVVVVTVVSPEGPRGATIGSFTSVALSPALVSFNVTQGTRFHDALRVDAAVAIHLLASDQAAVASHFAVPDLDGEAQLAPFAHVRLDGQPPVLDGTLGVLHGRVERGVAAGDHTVVFVRVEHLAPGTGGEPLLYYQQSYRGVGRDVSA